MSISISDITNSDNTVDSINADYWTKDQLAKIAIKVGASDNNTDSTQNDNSDSNNSSTNSTSSSSLSSLSRAQSSVTGYI